MMFTQETLQFMYDYILPDFQHTDWTKFSAGETTFPANEREVKFLFTLCQHLHLLTQDNQVPSRVEIIERKPADYLPLDKAKYMAPHLFPETGSTPSLSTNDRETTKE